MGTFLLILAIIIMLAGLAGTVIPGLPGALLIFGGALLYAILTNFSSISLATILVLLVLAIVSWAIMYIGQIYGAKKFGKASLPGMIGAVIGAIIGIIVLNIIGLIIGAILGAFLGELLNGKSKKDAWQSGLGTLFGTAIGIVTSFTIGLIMIGLFVAAIL